MTSSLVLYEASQPGASSVLARTLAAILNRCFQNLFKVNDLVIVTVNSSVALFADDTKCYRPITTMMMYDYSRKTSIESLYGVMIGGWISTSLNVQ